MIYIFGTLLWESSVVIGTGLWAGLVMERLLGKDFTREIGLGGIAVLGIIVLGSVVVLVNFVAPVGNAFSMIVAALALSAYWFGRRTLGTALRSFYRGAIIVGLLLLVTMCTAAAINDHFLNHFDTGLYHLQTVLMHVDRPILIGAANIHQRFGTNSFLYAVAAAFYYPVIGIGGSVLVNGVITIAICGALLETLLNRKATLFDLAPMFFAIWVLARALNRSALMVGAGSPNTEWPGLLFSSYIVVLALEVIGAAALQPDRDGFYAARLFMISIGAAFAITIKVSQLWTFPIAAAITLWALLPSAKIPWTFRTIAISIACAATIGLIWVIHGLLLSGCVVYLATASCVPSFPWTVPFAIADNDMRWMKAWGRIPGSLPDQVLNTWAWLPQWTAGMLKARFIQWMGWALFAVAVLLLLRLLMAQHIITLFERYSRSQRAIFLLLLGALASGLALWFFVSPLLRYGEGPIYLFMGLLLTAVLPTPSHWKIDLPEAKVWGYPASTLLRPAVLVPLFVSIYCVQNLQNSYRRFFVTSWPSIPEARVESHRTSEGFEYSVALEQQSCWAAAWPCAPAVISGGHYYKIFLWQVLERPDPSTR